MNRSKLLASVAGATTLAALSVAALGLMAVAAPTPAHAANPVCPTIVDTAGFGATNCNDYITLNGTPNGGFTVTETFPQATPYDGSDDNYVGIFNNTTSTFTSFSITGPAVTHHNGIFGGMDGDGICETSRFSSAGFTCTGTVTGIGAGQNYAPTGVVLNGTTSNFHWWPGTRSARHLFAGGAGQHRWHQLRCAGAGVTQSARCRPGRSWAAAFPTQGLIGVTRLPQWGRPHCGRPSRF